MGSVSDRTRVLVTALTAVGLTIASVLMMDWFIIHLGQLTGGVPDRATFDLRTVHVCPQAGLCVSVELSRIPVLTQIGFYTTIAPVVFWASLVFAAVVAYQAATKLLSDHASESITKVGYGIGVISMLCAAATGFLFTPDIPPLPMSRTIAPLLLLVAYASGLACLYFVSREAVQIPVATATIHEPTPAPLPRAQTAPVMPRTRSRPIPAPLKGRLSYSTLTAALSPGGIDAHREDGEARLVLWRDVVGAVARRLPAGEPFNGIPFVDVVSNAGSTLRLLPWTRLSGEPIEGDSDDQRCRAFVKLVVGYCPELQLDRATKEFVDGSEPPAQLPDDATLAAHDQRLA
ncbi:MAG TPA: hypothetical protein VGO00_30285 [Kofleriaceae bacterium]|nr:hypothetical protein [Kofleriaceae bacterium]